MIERWEELSQPVEQKCRLVIRLYVIGLKLQNLPVHLQGFLNRLLLASMFLIQPPQVQVGADKPRSQLRGQPEI